MATGPTYVGMLRAHTFARKASLRRLERLADELRPAILTLSMVALMLGLLLSVLVVLIAWVRTPADLYTSTLPGFPRMVRGGEPLAQVAGWLSSELWPAVGLTVTGWLGMLGTRDTESARGPQSGPGEAVAPRGTAQGVCRR